MWGRVLAVSGGALILAVTVALWYSDHQQSIGIISKWQTDYDALLTDRGNINIQNVQLIRQNRQLVGDKQQLSDGVTALNQKIDTLSVQIDELVRANELAEVAASDLEKERKINQDLSDESGRLRQELETLRAKSRNADDVSVYENDCTGAASCAAVCRLEGRERAIGGSCRVMTEEQRASGSSPGARSYDLRRSGKLTNDHTWTCDGGQQLASALVMCRKVDD